MKSIFIIFLISLLLGCAIPNTNKSQLKDSSLSTQKLLQHINFLQKYLARQGFGVAVVKPKNNQINLDVKINDHNGKLLIDSGASSSFLSHRNLSRFELNEYIYKHGEKPLIETHLGGIISDSFPTKADSFEVGNTVFKPWSFIVAKTQEKHGVLGIDFLNFTSSVLIVRIGALFLHPEGKPVNNIANELKSLGYTEIKLFTEEGYGSVIIKRQGSKKPILSGLLTVPVQIDGTQGLSMIDTGSITTMIDKPLAVATHKPIRRFHPSHKLVDANGDTSRVSSVCLSDLCIGGFCPKDEQCVGVLDYSHDYTNDNAKENIVFAGVIGFDTLHKYNAIIDFGNKRLYLQK